MKIFKKIKKDMKEVRDKVYELNFFQLVWLVVLVFMTVNSLLRFLDKFWKKVVEYLEKYKKRKAEQDYSDQCPDEYEDPFSDDD